METCKKCGQGVEGYKCDMCGDESVTHDANHGCGGEHCMPKCVACSEAEAKCTCEGAVEESAESADETVA